VNWKVSSEEELDDLLEILNGCRDAFYTEGEWIWHHVSREGEPPLVTLRLHITYFYHGEFKEVLASELFMDEDNGCAMFIAMWWYWDDLEKQLETILTECPTDILVYTASERISKETHGRVIFLRDVPADRHSGERWERMKGCTTTALGEEDIED